MRTPRLAEAFSKKDHPATPADRESLGVGFAIVVIIACAVSWLSQKLLPSNLPPQDGNVIAYNALCDGLKTGRYVEAGRACDQAYALASDPDLRAFSSLMARYCKLAVTSNIQTFEEGDSLSSLLKAFMTGLMNPRASVEGLALTYDLFTTDTKSLGDRLDARYQPEIQKIIEAIHASAANRRRWGWGILVAVLAIGGYLVLTKPGITKYLSKMRNNT